MATKKPVEKIILAAEKREILGKQVKSLRRDGFIPANIFGKDFESLAVTIPLTDFTKTYNDAGETGVVYVKVDSDEHPTLIKSVQKHPVNDYILHVDFRKINLRQKIETDVPLEFVGEAPGVKEGGVVLYQQDVLTIEALPANIPSQIEIDLSILTEIGQDVKVSDLPKSEDYEITSDPEMVIVSLTAHKEESVEPDVTTTIPDAVEGEAAAEGAEGEAAPAEEAGEKSGE
jgi:large subunit ribosomal protein L25